MGAIDSLDRQIEAAAIEYLLNKYGSDVCKREAMPCFNPTRLFCDQRITRNRQMTYDTVAQFFLIEDVDRIEEQALAIQALFMVMA
jgi:hypothetical protein